MSNQSGYVYLLKNEAMPGIYKIGMTNRTVEERVKELSLSTSVPLPFEIVCSIKVDDAKEAEEELHEEFAEFRINENREFFKFDDDKFKNAISSFAGYSTSKIYEAENEMTEIFGDDLEEKLTHIAMQNLYTEPYFMEVPNERSKYIEGSILLSLLKECYKHTSPNGKEYVMVPLVLHRACSVKEYKEMLKRNMDPIMLKLCIKNMNLQHDPFNLKELLED